MKLYGLVGRSLHHSFSEQYFRDKFAREGIEGCQYRLFELPSLDELPRLLGAQPALRGLNVTIPYKEAVLPYLDRVDEMAAAIGAVNCIRFGPEGLVGYNTDVEGIRQTLDRLTDEPVRGALVLGTGGASRAVQWVLRERGISCRTVSRTPQRGDLTYAEVDGAVLASVTLIVHATPVGTWPAVDQAPSLPYSALTRHHRLFDLVYNPPLTRFLQEGAERGARGENGRRMLEVQAEASWALWQR